MLVVLEVVAVVLVLLLSLLDLTIGLVQQLEKVLVQSNCLILSLVKVLALQVDW